MQLWQGGSWASTTKSDFVYNGSHQPVLAKTSPWIGVWLIEPHDPLKYADTLLIEQVSVDDFTMAVSRTQHTYNSDAQEIEELSQDWDDGAQEWVNTDRMVWVHSGGTVQCCVGTHGNINVQGIVDLSDLSALINYLTGGGYVLPCTDAANINGVGIIDLSDLSALINYLTGGGYIIPNCP